MMMKKWMLMTVMALAMLISCAMAEEVPTAIVYFGDGSMVMIPAEIANDPARLEEYCDQYFPGRFYSFDASAGDYDAVLSQTWTSAQYGEGSRAVGVQIEQMGIQESVVNLQGSSMSVPSKYLQFGDNEDARHRIGVVYAPRSGEASLRDDAGSKGSVVAKAKTGRIVGILQYDGGNYTKILYDGKAVYIRTDCLVFFSGEEVPVGNGVIHLNGNTDGSKTVTIRATASNSQAKVIALPTGTNVKVYDSENSWYTVEADGWYGYVQEQYLKME